MSGSNTGAGFGARGFGGGRGPERQLADAIGGLRSMIEQRVEARLGGGDGGDVRAAVLALLAERPMAGSQLIAEIERHSGGAWKPSPGSVYPTLQLLVDEGLISSEAVDGRRTYALTETGRSEAEAAAGRGAPWAASDQHGLLGGRGALPKAGFELAQAAGQLGRVGSQEQVAQAVAVLDEARRKLYTILAQD